MVTDFLSYKSRQLIARIFLMAVIFFSGFLFKLVVDQVRLARSIKVEDTEIRLGRDRLINPLLECNFASELDNRELASFKSEIKKLIDKKKSSGQIDMAAVYFRDLNNGPWFGINEKEKFAPASLMKVPLMIYYLKQAESDPNVLQKFLTYGSEDEMKGQHYMSRSLFVSGNSYSVEDLITDMIVNSDNKSMIALFENLDENKYNAFLGQLGINMLSITDENFLTVKDYAAFFRILFNASYLTSVMSNKALQLLTQTKFDKGLVAGLPDGLMVAHKFGEREAPEYKQLHDCGIVYHPAKPYLLCVMSRGDDYEELADFIKEISFTFYQQIENQLD